MSDNRLFLGMDLSPEYTQLSFYNQDTGEPESVYQNESKGTYLLPNILFYSEEQEDVQSYGDDGPWSAGSSASSSRFKEEGILVDRIYDKVLNHDIVEIGDITYKAKDLLVKMLVLHIKNFMSKNKEYELERLVITIADEDESIIKALSGLRPKLGLSEDNFKIVSHLDSGLYYIFNQPESLRNNSVGLFDFGTSGLYYYRVDITRSRMPNVVKVVHKDMRDRLNFADFKQDKDELDDKFAEIAKECMSENYISSVFLTGLGFTDNWMKTSAGVLCQGRRVFVGQNIYTKGACLRAFGDRYDTFRQTNFIDTEYTVKWDVGISLMDESDTFEPITSGGEEWFNTKGRICLFIDETNRLDLVYKNAVTGDKKVESIEIQGLPKRPPKTTRISLEVEFYDALKGAVIIRDEGFGSMFPTTNRIYRKEFNLG